MSVRMTVEYEGGLRCAARHAPSGTELATDAPSDNRGKGARFSPTDLLGAALGSCMLTTMGIVASEIDVDLSGATVVLEKEMVADPKRRVGAMPVAICVPSYVPEQHRKVLERAAFECPVQQSLDPRITRSVSFSWSGPPGLAGPAGDDPK